MKIIYIAYSCNPYNGSEDQIGWNVPYHNSIDNEIIVITKPEQKRYIDLFFDGKEKNITFEYVDVSSFAKRVFKGPFYSMRLILWQKKVKKLIEKKYKDNIDVLHQIAPIEYRAIGDYDVEYPQVLGPIGGGFSIPQPLDFYSKGHFTEYLRKIFNYFSFKKLKHSKKISKFDYVFFTNEETKMMFDNHNITKNIKQWEYQCDVGICDENIHSFKFKTSDSEKVFFIPGRLNYRKGHRLLFDAIPRNYEYKGNVIYKIAGNGPYEKKLRKIVSKDDYLKKHVEFLGKIDFEKMQYEYTNCDVVILPSLSEATGTVLIEGLALSKPFIAANNFGAKILADSTCSWQYKGKNRYDLIESFRNCILEAIEDSQVLFKKSSNCIDCVSNYTWTNKVKKYNDIYRKIR